ncbi:MAG: hypothetical protein PHS92_02070 [Candidatus Gracilibacteria bacterium]|nr:hypothetical protein [Candidatus Gracilibacteria bacterium]
MGSATSDNLFKQAEFIANQQYTEEDIRLLLSCLSEEEKKLLDKHIYAIKGQHDYRQIVLAWCSVVELSILKQARLKNLSKKIPIILINPKGKQDLTHKVRFIS